MTNPLPFNKLSIPSRAISSLVTINQLRDLESTRALTVEERCKQAVATVEFILYGPASVGIILEGFLDPSKR